MIHRDICDISFHRSHTAIGECNSPDLTAFEFQFVVVNVEKIKISQSEVIAEYNMINTVSVISI